MMKSKITAALAAVALGVGLSVIAVAAPASAHTPSYGDTCSTFYADLVDYSTVAEVSHEELVSPEVAAVEGVAAVEEVLEVSHIDYEYKALGWHGWDFRWSHSDKGAVDFYDGRVWVATGGTDTHVEVEYVAPVEGVEAVAYQPAVYQTIIDQEADATPNTVVITIDGVEVANESFGASYSGSFDFDNRFVAHDWTIDVVSADGIGNVSDSGTSMGCEIPVVAPNPAATITAECGFVSIELTNVEAEYEDNLAGSAVLYIDGEYEFAYFLPGNEVVLDQFNLDEDSGVQHFEVRTGPAFGDILLAEADVETDCEQAEVPPTEEEPTPTVVTPEKPAAPAAATPVEVVQSDILASTGYDARPLGWMALIGLVAGLLLLGGVTFATRHQR